METRIRANEDRISQLPIELIHVILSFMDAKYAVQTCALSKRWKLIWKSLPHLNFQSGLFHRKDIFIKFVRHVLSCRDNNAGISSIKYISNSISIPLAQRIIRFAISHNAEHLNIRGCRWPVKSWVRYSPLIFSSPLLKQLSLRVNVEVLDTWNFPALTSLDIEYVHFKFLFGENSEKSANPFSRLLSSRELMLTNCYYTGVEVINIASPGLLKLSISTTDHEKTKFMLSTPNLSSFTYKGHFPLSLLANDLHCLEYVDIHIPYVTVRSMNRVDKRFVGDMITMFHQLSSTVSLRLSFEMLKLLHDFPEMITHECSPFRNLKCLKLVQRRYSLVSTIYNDAVIYLLNSSPRATVFVESE